MGMRKVAGATAVEFSATLQALEESQSWDRSTPGASPSNDQIVQKTTNRPSAAMDVLGAFQQDQKPKLSPAMVRDVPGASQREQKPKTQAMVDLGFDSDDAPESAGDPQEDS